MSLAVIVAAAAVRIWTRAYTSGMPPMAIERRRAEIESDLWELCHDPDGAPGVASAVHMLCRLLTGIADDIAWRLERTTVQDNVFIRRAVTLAATTVALSMLWSGGDSTSRAASCPASPRKARVDQVVECVGAFFDGIKR